MGKSKIYQLGVAAFLALFISALTSCGANPKALAKQSYDIGKQTLAAVFNPKKAEDLKKKAAAIEAKVAKLSESDQAVYAEELARLSGKGLGGLFEAAGGALDAATKAADSLDSAGKALDAATKAAGALDSANQLLDAASKLSSDPSVQDAQKALDTAKKAADLLKSAGKQ
jgi:hypothetical protein